MRYLLFSCSLLFARSAFGQVGFEFQDFPSASFPITTDCLGTGMLLKSSLIRNRFPTDNDFQNVPQSCRAKALTLLRTFVQEDQANWQGLMNRACSAMMGWVERVPGTCRAGGPPPICEADHWMRDPNNAMKEFDNYNLKTKIARAARLASIACDCWQNAIDQQESPSVGPDVARATGASGLLVVCTEGTCPSPYRCVKGLCRAPAALELIKKVPKSELIDQLKKRLPPFVNSTAFSALTKFLDPVVPKVEVDEYFKIVPDVVRTVDVYDMLYRKYSDPHTDPDTREALKRSFVPVCDGLKRSIATMQITYTGIVNEKQLGRYACYNVFQLQHQMLIDMVKTLVYDCPAPNPFSH